MTDRTGALPPDGERLTARDVEALLTYAARCGGSTVTPSVDVHSEVSP